MELCDCEKIMKELTKRHDKEKLLQFFFGLDTTIFGTIRSIILREDLLLNVNQAYSKLIQQEQLKNMDKESVTDCNRVVVFVVKNTSRSSIDKSTLVCGHYNKGGHESRNCFQIIGLIP